ncbi:MAG: WbuC family cupin fold metalloprotein, partial [Bacteroidales bacterium]|nr:WbuC family cupin fold metalloprotein [Bacteroidales bacterium]
MILINSRLLDALSLEAKEHPRKRKNHNFHTSLADPINRMLNAVEPESYVRPHKHEKPDKR